MSLCCAVWWCWCGVWRGFSDAGVNVFSGASVILGLWGKECKWMVYSVCVVCSVSSECTLCVAQAASIILFWSPSYTKGGKCIECIEPSFFQTQTNELSYGGGELQLQRQHAARLHDKTSSEGVEWNQGRNECMRGKSPLCHTLLPRRTSPFFTSDGRSNYILLLLLWDTPARKIWNASCALLLLHSLWTAKTPTILHLPQLQRRVHPCWSNTTSDSPAALFTSCSFWCASSCYWYSGQTHLLSKHKIVSWSVHWKNVSCMWQEDITSG